MNIVYVWDGDYPWDIRAHKVCTTLVEAGHSVQIAARNKARRPLVEVHEGITVRRLPFLPAWTGSAGDAVGFPAFFNPLWIWHIFRVVRSRHTDVLVVRDLPLALAALAVAKVLGVPCVLDMAECYPEMLRCTRHFEGHTLKDFFVRNPRLADLVERVSLRHLNQIWVMIEESRDRLLGMGVPPEKIQLVSNTPVVSRFDAKEPVQETGSAGLEVIYVGLLNPSRGLDTTIRAIAQCAAEDPGIRLTVIGSGKAESQLHALARELRVEEHVRFLGWVDNERVPDLLAQADVGIVPHHRCRHWDTTIPNKLFDYMASGIPVIVSDAIPMKRIVDETGCGMSYRDYDVPGLCQVFHSLKDASLRRELAERGRSAVKNEFNWAREKEVLLSALEDLAP